MSAILVVPCFDEAQRLVPARLEELARAIDGRVLVVDDGSRDATAAVIRDAVDPRCVDVLRLERNRGKAEAVRHGMQTAIARGAAITGYCDADFATPVEEVARLVERCRGGTDVVLASRVALMGHDIVRSPLRHYLGRVFATASSLTLGFEVYDTQCGAKVLRADDALRAALAEPFASRWAFDVELLGRLAALRGGVDGFEEVPLRAWRDEAGSKLTGAASIRAGLDLWRIRRQLRGYRARGSRPGSTTHG